MTVLKSLITEVRFGARVSYKLIVYVCVCVLIVNAALPRKNLGLGSWILSMVIRIRS